MIKVPLQLIILILSVTIVKAQEHVYDQVHFDYTLIPNISDMTQQQYLVKGAYHWDVQNSSIGIRSQYQFDSYLHDYASILSFQNFDEFHTLQLGLNYALKWKDNLQMNVSFTPVVSSNFSQSISQEDFFLTGALSITKKWENKNSTSRFLLGLQYDTTFGKPSLFPLLTYDYYIHHWNLKIGIPETKITYRMNHHYFSAYAHITGSYQNNSNVFEDALNQTFLDTKLEMQRVQFGIDYEYELSYSVSTVVRVGYIQNNEINIRDSSDRIITKLNNDHSISMNLGFKINLNRNKNED